MMPRDFVKVAREYAKKAADPKNSKTFCFWMRLAGRRFLRDLDRAKAKGAPFYFDPWHANDVCDFAEKLPHVEGVWDSPTIVLHESHVFFLVNLFGFRKPDGTRRFTTALFAVARKNAKSVLASIIGLYCQVCEGEVGPQVISAATTGQQARIVFRVAKAMVDKTPELQEAFSLKGFANAIASYENGGTFKPINARASTQDGLNPSCSIFDEVHAHQNPDLINVVRSAAGARRNPLFLYLTTEGYANPGPWGEEREFAKKVLKGDVEADHYLVCYYCLDEENEEDGVKGDDDFDETSWIKANPLLPVNPLLLQEIRKAALEAKEKPSAHAEMRIKRLNRPASVAKGWVNLTLWRECNRPIDLEMLREVPCYGGLDLSSTTDLTSFRLVWEIDDVIYTYGWRWVPRSATLRRTTRGMVPYAGWIQAGLLIEAGDEVVDYREVEDKVLQVKGEFNLQDVGFDVWNASQSAQRLRAGGVQLTQFIQGPKSYHPAMKRIEVAYRSGKLVHGNDPILNWNASNLVARQDANLNTAPDKQRATDKIDDFCSLLMGVGRLVAEKERAPAHQLFFA